ncbi:hypothetical protein F0562_012456 [Nyssa sinensis]|uniref:Transcription repressor n=1 Tax=Nyssa sinensis TaxID=561372 RepID=A0A5J4ZSL0_9ASTE|nr:hypothetical protein F0562_012456 [Nyssa sinensis]
MAKTARSVRKEALKVSEPKYRTDTEGRTCPPVTPISPLKSKGKERTKQSTIKKSCSSNGGWFSSEEQGEVDGETDTFFSLSSDSNSEFFGRKTSSSGRNTATVPRRRGNSAGSEIGRSVFEVSVSSTDTFSDIGSSRRKTVESIRRKTTKDCRRIQMGRRYPFVLERKIQEGFETSASSSDSYSDFGSFHLKTTESHQKATKTSRKTGETRPRTEKGRRQSVPNIEIQESSEVKASSTDFYSDHFASYHRKTGKTRQKKKRGQLEQNSEMRRCAVVVDGKAEESYAMEKTSTDPHSDFRTSMLEMIVEKQIFGAEDLERLLQRFLSLNSSYHHKVIVQPAPMNLLFLAVPMDDDDLTEKILDGLGSDYKDLVHAVHARDTPITFDELHEKLLTFEAHLQEKKPDQSYLPASANAAHCTISCYRPSGWCPSSTTTQSPHFGPTNAGWRPSSTNT